MAKYLIMECNELADQYECDADRFPVCLVDDWADYNKYGYEVYEVLEDNTFKLIRNYEQAGERKISVCVWNSLRADDIEDAPNLVIDICSGDRDNVTIAMIEDIKKRYHFKDDIEDIRLDIKSSGQHGEEINGKWVGFGERIDDAIFPYGF